MADITAPSRVTRRSFEEGEEEDGEGGLEGFDIFGEGLRSVYEGCEMCVVALRLWSSSFDFLLGQAFYLMIEERTTRSAYT